MRSLPFGFPPSASGSSASTDGFDGGESITVVVDDEMFVFAVAWPADSPGGLARVSVSLVEDESSSYTVDSEGSSKVGCVSI